MLRKLLLPLVLLFAPPSLALEADNPYQIMQRVISRTFTRLNEEQRLISQNPNHLRSIVRQEIFPYVHLQYVGGLILGQNFAKLSAKQRQDYFQALDGYLEQSYAQVLTFYKSIDYKVEKERPLGEAKNVSILVNVLRKQDPPVHTEFKWRKNSRTNEWQLYDLSVEGISMVTTKQQEWGAQLQHKSIDKFITELALQARQPVVLQANP